MVPVRRPVWIVATYVVCVIAAAVIFVVGRETLAIVAAAMFTGWMGGLTFGRLFVWKGSGR